MNDYNNGYMAPIPSNMQNNYNPDISQNQIPNGIIENGLYKIVTSINNVNYFFFDYIASKMAFLSIRIRI